MQPAPPEPVEPPCAFPALPPHPSPPRPRLSSSDIDRHFEARLRSLSPPAPVSVYLPAPRADELQQRLERLQASGRDVQAVDEAELERRLKRLQGEDVATVGDGKHSSPAASSPPPYMPVPVYMSERDELDVMLKQVQDEVRLDYKDVYDTAAQLGQPLDSSSNQHRQKRAELKRASEQMNGRDAGSRDVDVDDAEQLMNELQRLPSTEIVKLKHVAGASYHSEDDYDDGVDDEG